MTMQRHLLALVFTACALCALADNYYCKYCGARYNSISSLTSGNCPRHPNGSYKGRHAVYQGDSDQKKYFCEYCGAQYNSISSMTSGNCPRHPDGTYKGRHSPSR